MAVSVIKLSFACDLASLVQETVNVENSDIPSDDLKSNLDILSDNVESKLDIPLQNPRPLK